MRTHSHNTEKITMPQYNADMSPFQNIDAMGLDYVRRDGSLLVYEIYDDAELLFAGTPSAITAWCLSLQDDSNIIQRKAR